VSDLQGALLDRAQVFVVARGEVEAVFLGGGGQQGQAADVVQQAGQVGFLGLRIIDMARQVARQHGRQQRVFPERAQVGRAGIREAVESLEYRVADHQGLDHVGAQRHPGLLEIGLAAAAMIGRAVGDREDLAGHAGILGHQCGQLGHAEVVGLQVGQQLDEDLRHGRQPRDQQAIADILVWLMVGLKHGRHCCSGLYGGGFSRLSCHADSSCGPRNRAVF
jgi:hypothetical protein